MTLEQELAVDREQELDFDPAGGIELPVESGDECRSSGTTYSKCE